MKTYSPLRRSGFPQVSFAEALQARLAKQSKASQNGRPERSLKRSNQPLKPGRRMKHWSRVWSWLKPRLEAAGRTSCEFDFIIHECWGPLDPVHSKKRRMMEGDDVYAVAIGCRKVHGILDEKTNHETMEVAVMYAITRAGGLITPATEAAKKVESQELARKAA